MVSLLPFAILASKNKKAEVLVANFSHWWVIWPAESRQFLLTCVRVGVKGGIQYTCAEAIATLEQQTLQ